MRSISASISWRYGCRLIVLLIGFCGVAGLGRVGRAQDAAPAYDPLSMDDLQQLVAPIALYPDALLAQVLTASTYPNDVAAAAQWESAGNDPANAAGQPWDPSVQGVAHFPSVLQYMAANGDWMNNLGDAFLNQQSDVMAAVQNLRGEALAAGTLVSNAQQTVVNQDGYIQIIPTNPDDLCVPIYDPAVIYTPPAVVVGQPYPTYITYGPQIAVGTWLDYDFDWHDRAIYFGQWGADRPWWHDHDHYLTDRPGVYRPGAFKDVHGRPIQVQAGRWARDDRRPAPLQFARPARRPAAGRPERGYAPPAAPNHVEVNRPPAAAEVARQSERGQASREVARPAPQPVRRAPEPQCAPEPQRPAPEARQSAPVRGGAMGGYQNGNAASHSADRGAASRGRR